MMPQDRLSAFGDALRQGMLAERMSQADLAKATKVHPSQVNRWVHGRAMPGMENICKLEKLLKIDLSKVLANPTREYELFVAAPEGGLNSEDVADHHADVAKVLRAARKHVRGIYWPSEEDKTAADRTYKAAVRTEQNLRVLNGCPALLYLQFAAVVNPSSAYIELGYALGRKMKLTIMVKGGLMVPYMLRDFGAVRVGLREVGIFPNIASADEAAELIASNGRELLGLAK
jgi:transcriptional regulator with XRE-family HTH domain